MAKYSMKKGGKEVGPANVYAEPHTMRGKPVKAESQPGRGPNRSDLNTMDMSAGNINRSVNGEKPKTDGIKIRGTGAATKGVMARGPMA